MTGMKARWTAALVALLWPLSAWAQEGERAVVDARLEGYPQNVTLDGGSFLAWLTFGVVGVICIGVMFKNARRTHLD